MDARELRIGNWVNWTGNNKQIWPLDLNSIIEHQKSSSIVMVEPILLTKDWLVKFKFGAERSFTGRMCYYKDGFIFEYLKSGGVWITILGVKRKNWTICKYVHQLQNLYLDLKEKEL